MGPITLSRQAKAFQPSPVLFRGYVSFQLLHGFGEINYIALEEVILCTLLFIHGQVWNSFKQIPYFILFTCKSLESCENASGNLQVNFLWLLACQSVQRSPTYALLVFQEIPVQGVNSHAVALKQFAQLPFQSPAVHGSYLPPAIVRFMLSQ